MRQVFKRIPVYTGDVSGVCSALYELGGMVVMHDPSGCNSTYNTHDEIRWYDRDSLIFLSGLNEMDAIMGSDESLIHDIVEAAEIYHPAFIAIANSPIPYITGMDFDGICRIVEQQTGIPAFYISTNGMHDYTQGAGLAFLHLAERFVEGPDWGNLDQGNADRKESACEEADQPVYEDPDAGTCPENRNPCSHTGIRCNILGVTPLDFAAQTCVASLHEKILHAGMEILSTWAMGDSLENIRRSGSAQVSLVVSSAGLPVAEYLQKQFGIPYVAGFPAEGTEEIYFQAVRDAVETGNSRFPFREREWMAENRSFSRKEDRDGRVTASRDRDQDRDRDRGQDRDGSGNLCGDCGQNRTADLDPSGLAEGGMVCLIGEPLLMTSLAASIQWRTGVAARVFGTTENAQVYLGKRDRALCGEEELEQALRELVGPAEDSDRDSDKEHACVSAVSAVKDKSADQGTKTVKVVADPCYKDILPAGCELVRLPHLAFSGRIFLREIPDLIRLKL